MKYENMAQLRNDLCNFKSYCMISGGEKSVFDCLSKVSDNYAWAIYKAVSDLVDQFMKFG